MKLETIILAAGSSSRMGKDKALLQVNGISVIKTIIDKVSPFSSKVIIIAGENYSQLKTEYDVIYNEQWQKGMFSSLQKGLAASSANCWLMLHLIDHPFIKPETYSEMIQAIDEKYLVIKPFLKKEKKSGHPLLLSSEIRDILLSASPDSILKNVLHSLPAEKILRIAVADEGIIDNLNTYEDFQQRIKKKRRRRVLNRG
ncbi:MAG: nucleotidyltransferase family protein [Candidatus Cloacimonetes bacterium]|nr:nucleotidyltransferase family protein [Candidatus Cloacimonadota bacterium]